MLLYPPPCNPSPPCNPPPPQGGEHHFDIYSVKSKPAKPAAKGLETKLHSLPRLPILSLYLNCTLSMSMSSRLFGVIKRSFTQCLWKGHAHRSNIMFQCDSHYRCCACTAAVLKCCGLVVQSPPPPPWGGTVTTLGARLQGGGGEVHSRARILLHIATHLVPISCTNGSTGLERNCSVTPNMTFISAHSVGVHPML